MTAPTVLEQLRAAGLEVSPAGDKVRVRGNLTPELEALALGARDQVLADLAEEAAAASLHCPRCRRLDYEPPSKGHRRCLRCGELWNIGRVRVVRVNSVPSRAYQLVDAAGAPLGVGLFVSREWALEYASERGWEAVG